MEGRGGFQYGSKLLPRIGRDPALRRYVVGSLAGMRGYILIQFTQVYGQLMKRGFQLFKRACNLFGKICKTISWARVVCSLKIHLKTTNSAKTHEQT